MPGCNTKFSSGWLEQIDGNGHSLRLWCRSDDKDIYSAFRFLCYKKVPCTNMGLRQLLQHATGDKHTEIAITRFSKTVKHLTVANARTPPSDASQRPHTGQQMMSKSHLDQVTTAKCYGHWRWFRVTYHLQCDDDVGKLFNSMFPGSVSNDFQCGSTKMGYLITHGVAPYFEELLLNDIRRSNNGYTLHFDETTTSQTKKQMDIIVWYWSVEHNRIVVQYLGSLFFGYALSTTVVE